MARDKPALGSTRAPSQRRTPGAVADREQAPPREERLPTLLTSAQARFLRGQAHDLKAILQIGGKGLTETLLAEVDVALEHHELVKVKIAAEDRDARDALIAKLAERSHSALVQRIGHVAVLYRQSAEKRQIVLPRA